MMQLADYGWQADMLTGVPAGLVPGRVVADFGTSVRVAMPETVPAELSGRLAHYVDRQAAPKIGDWVAVRRFASGSQVIEAVLPRVSELARKTAGATSVRQVIATNIDIAFVLTALDRDFNVARLSRYLYQLFVSNIEPVIVLNKADKAENPAQYTQQLARFSQPIIIAEAVNGVGVADIAARIGRGKTAILLGSSGVGKSTLTNCLIGREAQRTQLVRESDDTGRHTTVHRELFVLPNGGLLIDTPGIRELQLWGTPDALADDFEIITTLAAACRFTTCRHNDEPGCAIQAALGDGTLNAADYQRYNAMKIELSQLKRRTGERAAKQNRRSGKALRRLDADRAND